MRHAPKHTGAFLPEIPLPDRPKRLLDISYGEPVHSSLTRNSLIKAPNPAVLAQAGRIVAADILHDGSFPQVTGEKGQSVMDSLTSLLDEIGGQRFLALPPEVQGCALELGAKCGEFYSAAGLEEWFRQECEENPTIQTPFDAYRRLLCGMGAYFNPAAARIWNEGTGNMPPSQLQRLGRDIGHQTGQVFANIIETPGLWNEYPGPTVYAAALEQHGSRLAQAGKLLFK